MMSAEETIRSYPIQKVFLLGVLLGLILVLLGWILVPAASLISVAGACLILVLYGLTGYFVFPRLSSEVMRTGLVFGLLAGVIFAGEILLEYAVLPNDNTSWGLVEFGSVFVLYFVSGLWAAYRSRSIKSGTLAAVLTAILSSVIWLLCLLLVFYLFRGTLRQELVLKAEGTFEDFARSGMSSFSTFVMEDQLGAGFFHLLLAPLIAAILGATGGVLGMGIAKLRSHQG
jgi:hypothetical protein